MDNNTRELMRRYELLDQEPVLEYSSLETEVDNKEPPSTLSTPSPVTDTDFPSPLLLFTPELDKSFSFDLQDILDLSTEEEKAELTGQNISQINNNSSHNSSSTENSVTTEDSSFDPDSLLNKEKTDSEKNITQKVLPPEENHLVTPKEPEEPQHSPKVIRRSTRRRNRRLRNPTPIPTRKCLQLLQESYNRTITPAPQTQLQPPAVTHFVTAPQPPVVAYNPAFLHQTGPMPLLQIPMKPTPGFAPRYIKYFKS